MIAVIQARITSSRFPGKVLKKVFKDLKVIDLMYKRLSSTKKVNKIIFAIPKNKKNQKLKDHLKFKKYPFYEGKEFDVLNRIYCAAKKFKAQNIIRLTADCPLLDGKTIDNHVNFYLKNKSNYVSNQINRTYPDGYDIEIISFKLLEKLNFTAKLKEDRSMSQLYLKRNRSQITTCNFKRDLSI